MRTSFEEEIKFLIEEICEENNLEAPITVFGAARLIVDYRSTERAIELFEGAMKETRSNIFRTSAYKATLETFLIPLKTNED